MYKDKRKIIVGLKRDTLDIIIPPLGGMGILLYINKLIYIFFIIYRKLSVSIY